MKGHCLKEHSTVSPSFFEAEQEKAEPQHQEIWLPSGEPPQEDTRVLDDWFQHEDDTGKVPVAGNVSCSVGFSPSLY